jgi:holo-[acyl-carrier protein] synthase
VGCDRRQRATDETGSAIELAPVECLGGSRQYHRLIMPDIIGLGLDSTDIIRVETVVERWGDRFVRRVFTDGEIAYCQRRRRPAIHFAGRFAAKEAAMKALGTGHSQEVLWRDVEVVRHGGPPRLLLHGGAGRRFASMGGGTSLLTITHSETVALAQVLLLGR